MFGRRHWFWVPQCSQTPSYASYVVGETDVASFIFAWWKSLACEEPVVDSILLVWGWGWERSQKCRWCDSKWQWPFCCQQRAAVWRMGAHPAWRKSGRNMSGGNSAVTGKGLYQLRKYDNILHLLPSQHLWNFLLLLLYFKAEVFHQEERPKKFHLVFCNPMECTNILSMSLVSFPVSACIFFPSM